MDRFALLGGVCLGIFAVGFIVMVIVALVANGVRGDRGEIPAGSHTFNDPMRLNNPMDPASPQYRWRHNPANPQNPASPWNPANPMNPNSPASPHYQWRHNPANPANPNRPIQHHKH